MRAFHASASRLVLTLMCTGMAAPAMAASFNVPPDSGPQAVSGTDTGTVAAGATLNTGNSTAITWNAPATGTGVVITNNGTITSTKRGIDTSGAVSGAFTLHNTGSLATTDDAFRINTPFANGTVTIDNAGTLHSQEGQALDFDAVTSSSAVVSITNHAGGTIASAEDDAMRLGGGTITIDNAGTISSDAARAIRFRTDASFDSLVKFELTNEAGGLIVSPDDAIKIGSTGSSTAAPIITITNAGTIRSTKGGQAIDLGGIASPNAVITITNQAGGLITADDNDGIQGANGMVVKNYGTISSNYAAGQASAQNNDAIKIEGTDTVGMTATITNYAGGLISGSYHGIKASGVKDNLLVTNYGTIEGRNGSGVNSNGTGTLTNYGTITGTFDPAAAFGDGDGVDFDQPGTIYNYGTIKGLGSKGVKEGESEPSLSEGIAIGGGTIVNGTASNTAALISGANNGILADNSNHGDAFAALSVTNYGTIEGKNGFGIEMVNGAGSFGNTIVNYGTISGTTFAVAMGNGADLFVYEAGSSVNGVVYAQGGIDTFRLGEVAGTFDAGLLGPAATYRDFEIFTLAEGSAWTVTGTSAFAGATQVNGASLNLADASLASSAVSVAGSSGLAGILMGTGTIGSLSLGTDGIVSPGAAGAGGALKVAGNAAFGAGSTYFLDNAGDTIAAGSATIAPGSGVVVEGSPGAFDWSTQYTIVSTANGRTGTFSSATDNYLFLDPTLSYDANNVYLSLDRNAVAFASYAVTANQRAAAAAIDRTSYGVARGSDLYDAIVMRTSADGLPLAFSELSGDIYGTLPGILFSENTLVNDALLGRVRQSDYAGATGATAALGFGGPMTSYAEPAPAPAFPVKAVKAVPVLGPVVSLWAQGYGQWLDVSSANGIADASSNVGGVLVGADARVGASLLGLAFGYSSSSTDSGTSSADTDTWRIAAYGGTAFDALKLRAGATYGWSSTDASRVVSFTGEFPKSSFDGSSANVFGEAAYTLGYGGVAFEPFAGLGWTHVDLDGFVENGAPVAGLFSSGSTYDTAYSTLGLRAAMSFDVAAGARLTPHATAGWRHAFGDVTPVAVVSYLDTGTSFGVEGLPIAEDSMVLGAGLDLALVNGWTLGVAYDGMFGDGATYNAAKGTAALRF